MNRTKIEELMRQILARQGKATEFSEESVLYDIGFRSLDFSELALRVEAESGRPLTFDAGPLRAIRTVKDVLDFLERTCGATNRPN